MGHSRTLLITGGAGFIGSHVVRHFVKKYPDYRIVTLDLLTYAGNLANLSDVLDAPNHIFVRGDVADEGLVQQIFTEYGVDGVIHLAAESHVDRSIHDPLAFVRTNVLGTAVLLNAARRQWDDDLSDKRFYHISTDEVYGSLGPDGCFTEHSPYDPHSPYSASKAGADHLVRAFHHTYGFPALLSNCSNNYGPYQFPEKLIPLTILRILRNESIPVYGRGENVRDWLWVGDHVEAIDRIFHQGTLGRTYLIGGRNEWKNIDLVRLICDLMDEKMKRPIGTSRALITFVKDREGHDFRYAIDPSSTESLGWQPTTSMEEGLRKTIDWYLANPDWIQAITSGEYRQFFEKHYAKRFNS